MPLFRKKPVEIEAVQIPADPTPSWEALPWLAEAIRSGEVSAHIVQHPRHGYVVAAMSIKTLEGTMRADAGDWIIQGVKGEIYPCKPDIFALTYEAVEAQKAPPNTLAECAVDAVEHAHERVSALAKCGKSAQRGRAVAKAKTKLDEARLWLREALES